VIEWAQETNFNLEGSTMVVQGFGNVGSNAAVILSKLGVSTIAVGDLVASHDVVAVTRRGGFLSAASRRLLEIIRADYVTTTSGGYGAGRSKPATRPQSKAGKKQG